MGRLSSPSESIKDRYKVVVIGSGYGGAIMASRLARAKQEGGEKIDVCVLERGKEFQPGEYPDTEVEAVEEFQVDLPEKHLGRPTGLYDFRVNSDINVFLGCGLGGTSLVNANVALRAEPRVFSSPRWPKELRNQTSPDRKVEIDRTTPLEEYYDCAEKMLKPTPLPGGAPPLPKLSALERSANYLHGKFYRPPINVNFDVSGPNHVGVDQQPCNYCGDCVSGCNNHAKNTLIMNYLPDAKNHGAEIFTEVAVRWIERADSGWVIQCQWLNEGREAFNAPNFSLHADIVVISAGTLGSTEILLRSAQKGLQLSNRLGSNFTGNGDVLAFGYDLDDTINGIGWGHRRPGQIPPVGPCITGIIDLRHQPELTDGMVIEEGSIPGALGATMPEALALGAGLVGQDLGPSRGADAGRVARAIESIVRGPYYGATKDTQTYLVMTHDDGAGRLTLENDRLRIQWPGLGAQPIFQRVNKNLTDATRPLGGIFVKDPVWSNLLGERLITVHPLGGCVMADSAEHGVVDHKGRAFSAPEGTDTYKGLYVSDGSIVPCPLGINPLLTISALAERSVDLLCKDRGWTIDYTLPSVPREMVAVVKPGIEFTETMKGFFSTHVRDNYERGAAQGEQENSTFQFTLTIVSEDVERMLTSLEHEARMFGTALAPTLSPEPLTITNGKFNLFTVDPNCVDTRNMRYRMAMEAKDGKIYYFEGVKIVQDGPLTDLWPATTTLYVTLFNGNSAASPVLGKGILKITPSDFRRQLGTMKVINATSPQQRLASLSSFARSFAGVLLDSYGGVFARDTLFNPNAPARKKRPLRVSAPEVHFFKTTDGVELRLTRYKGGKKGPVILCHGLGVSSLIFSIDTIETNLLEYLFAQRFDVWLLDFRASIDLPASKTQFTADDVAKKDYPAAVAKVRELTGSNTVQMVVHCYGSTTFTMAMLAGLQGVRSAVCSQISTHIVAPTLNRIRTGLHLPDILDRLGVKSLTAYVDAHADWHSRLYDEALKFYPKPEHCDNPVCHRITFMYAPLYRHEQLDEVTHAALHEMFGVANVKAFEGLALMTRKGHVVSADGTDAYLPYLERMAIPIAFIHGQENECFLPKSTEITYDLLCQRNGKNLYARHVIPGYGHIDCIYGKNAVVHVFPFILEHLDATNS